jgi:hypothetical protein
VDERAGVVERIGPFWCRAEDARWTVRSAGGRRTDLAP